MRACDPVLFYRQGPVFIGCAWACKSHSRTSLESIGFFFFFFFFLLMSLVACYSAMALRH